MDRRQILEIALPAVFVAAVGGATRFFEVELVDTEVSYDRPAYDWALGLSGAVHTTKLTNSTEVTALSSFPADIAAILRAAAGLNDDCTRSTGDDSDKQGPPFTAAGVDSECDGHMGFGEPPTRLVEALTDVTWVSGFSDERARAFTLVPTLASNPPPIAIETTMSGKQTVPGTPATLTLTARNRAELPMGVYSGVRSPFGMVALTPVDEDSHLLITYLSDNPLEHLSPFRSAAVASALAHDRYDPGEEKTRHYQLRATERGMRPGRYRETGSFDFGTLVPPAPDPDDHQIENTPSEAMWSVEWAVTVRISRPI